MITEIVILSTFLLLLIYTAKAPNLWGVKTISRAIRDSSWRFSIVPYITGLLIGHWMFNHTGGPLYGWGWGIPVMLILIGIDLYREINFQIDRPKWRHPAIYCSLGVLSGFLFWSLSY